MNKFFAFVIKEFKHIIRDYRTLLILFGMPIAQILLFGFAITNEIKDAPIAILDYSKDNVTEEISNKIISTGYFKLYKNLQSVKEIEPAFREGKIKEIIVFEENFGNNLHKHNKANIQLITDASDPNFANMIIGYTTSIINNYQQGLITPDSKMPLINIEYLMMYNPELKSVFMFVPGLMSVIMLLVSALMTSISIAKEKEMGTMEILLVSPLKPIQIVAGKVIPYFFLTLVNYSVILLLSKFVFHVPIEGSFLLLLLESILFLITALSLGILISTVSNNQQTALFISLGALMLPSIMLSDYIFPIENMPLPLQLISNIIPAKWFIRIVRGIMLKGLTFNYLLLENMVLLVMIIVLNALTIKKFKTRLE